MAIFLIDELSSQTAQPYLASFTREGSKMEACGRFSTHSAPLLHVVVMVVMRDAGMEVVVICDAGVDVEVMCDAGVEVLVVMCNADVEVEVMCDAGV
jgi:hypothetical protein